MWLTPKKQSKIKAPDSFTAYSPCGNEPTGATLHDHIQHRGSHRCFDTHKKGSDGGGQNKKMNHDQTREFTDLLARRSRHRSPIRHLDDQRTTAGRRRRRGQWWPLKTALINLHYSKYHHAHGYGCMPYLDNVRSAMDACPTTKPCGRTDRKTSTAYL